MPTVLEEVFRLERPELAKILSKHSPADYQDAILAASLAWQPGQAGDQVVRRQMMLRFGHNVAFASDDLQRDVMSTLISLIEAESSDVGGQCFVVAASEQLWVDHWAALDAAVIDGLTNPTLRPEFTGAGMQTVYSFLEMRDVDLRKFDAYLVGALYEPCDEDQTVVLEAINSLGIDDTDALRSVILTNTAANQ
jgi:hypothetical protein